MEGRSSKRTFCGNACRQRAYRRRKQGLPETFLADGADPRGPVSLRTFRERIHRVSELLDMGVELNHERMMFLLRR
jgi:hypothetical protein